MQAIDYGSVSTPISLLIVDDHEIFREGLASLLSHRSDLRVVAQAADGASALDQLLIFKPGVVVVDVSLPDMNGAALARKIKNRLPDTRVVALSMHDEPQFLELMLREGVSAYVVKNDAFKELVQAIQSSLEGNQHPYLSKSARAAALWVGGRQTKTRVLSEREAQVLRLLAGGAKNREVADMLNVSIKTVDTYRRRVMGKLNIDNSADMVKKAIALGLAEL
jgi:DNA-binding NarL/FixJ family response regulator